MLSPGLRAQSRIANREPYIVNHQTAYEQGILTPRREEPQTLKPSTKKLTLEPQKGLEQDFKTTKPSVPQLNRRVVRQAGGSGDGAFLFNAKGLTCAAVFVVFNLCEDFSIGLSVFWIQYCLGRLDFC